MKMSSNAKHYDYYMVEGADVKKIIDAYDDIQKRQTEILSELTAAGNSVLIIFRRNATP